MTGYEGAAAVIKEVSKAVRGKDEILRKVMMAVIAKGHILMEDIPGVGKTTLALAFAKAMSLESNRVQFTTDTLPSDILGFSMYNAKIQEFEYREGAIMCNLFLADEINRTSSKTQAALLEALEERQTTVDGVTRKLPSPFIVIATENPVGSAGTQRLPESQLDRFMIRLTMGYPDKESEMEVLKDRQQRNPIDEVVPVIDRHELNDMQNEADSLCMDDAIYEYVVMLSAYTRTNPYIELGMSPRGTLSFAAMARAHAYLSGRKYVAPEDVQAVLADVAGHRIILNAQARLEKKTADVIIKEIIKKVPVPRAAL